MRREGQGEAEGRLFQSRAWLAMLRSLDLTPKREDHWETQARGVTWSGVHFGSSLWVLYEEWIKG